MDINKRYRLVIVGFIVMVILNIFILGSLWIFRPPFHDHHDEVNHPRLQHIFRRELNLTDQQEQQFDRLRKDYRSQIRTALQYIREDRRKLYLLIGSTDSLQTDSLTTRIAEGHKRIETINVRHFREMRSLLNVKQQEKFDHMLQRVIKFSTRR